MKLNVMYDRFYRCLHIKDVYINIFVKTMPQLQCRELYACLREAMERAAARGKVTLTGRDLGGEFPVQEMDTKQGGLLQVRIDGVALLFEDRQVIYTRGSFCRIKI